MVLSAAEFHDDLEVSEVIGVPLVIIHLYFGALARETSGTSVVRPGTWGGILAWWFRLVSCGLIRYTSLFYRC